MSDLPPTPGERPSRPPHGEARNHQPLPAWLGRLSIYIASLIGIIDYVVAAGGDTDLVLEATAIALVALIIAGRARVMRVGPSMILVGLAYLVLAAVVIGWGEILAGVAMILTGAVAVTFGTAIIGPRTIAARARHLAERATKARVHLKTGLNALQGTQTEQLCTQTLAAALTGTGAQAGILRAVT